MATKKLEMERTFVMIKPDGVQRRLIGEIIQKYERKGLKLIAMNFVLATDSQIKSTYRDEIDAPYFPLLMTIMRAGPVVTMVWEGPGAVAIGSLLKSEGKTEDSQPGSIRGDYCLHVGRNACHSAVTMEEAEMDIGIWFPELQK